MPMYMSSGKAAAAFAAQPSSGKNGGGGATTARPSCAYCDKPIPEGCVVSFDGKNFHDACFEKSQSADCAHCGKVVPER